MAVVQRKNLPCIDCEPKSYLSCADITLLSTNNTVLVGKSFVNGKCQFDLKVNLDNTGGFNGISIIDTDTIKLLGDGLNTALRAMLKLSNNPDNLIEVDEEGLLVLAPGLTETPNSKVDTQSIAINLSGTSNRNIRADVKISSVAGNALTLMSDGLYAPESSGGGGGGGAVVGGQTASVTITGSGTSANPLVAVVRISGDAGNELEVRSNGLYYKAKTHYSLTGTDFTGNVYTNTDLENKGLSVWLFSIGRFIYEDMGELNVLSTGGFEVLIPGFDAATDKVEVFVKS